MTFWLGKPGSLTALPSPGKGIQPTLLRPAKTTTTLGGGQIVQRASSGRRSWTLTWRRLSHDVYSVLEEFYTDARGAGPFVFLDPGRLNLLTLAQSSATSQTSDTTGFSAVGTGETLSSVTTPVARGPRALAWGLPASVTTGIIVVASPSTALTQYPVVVGQAYTAQAQVRGGGTDAIVDTTLALVWLDSTGATLSTTTGSVTTTSSGAFAGVTVSGTAPTNAVYVRLEVHVAAASVSATSIVYVDKPILAMAASLSIWALGTGVPLVSIAALTDAYQTLPYHSPVTMTLVEVA